MIAIDGRHLVLRTDCTVEEEILILLHNAGESGMSRAELGRSVPRPAPTITNAVGRLAAVARREVLKRSDGTLVMTPAGAKRVYEELASKLALD